MRDPSAADPPDLPGPRPSRRDVLRNSLLGAAGTLVPRGKGKGLTKHDHPPPDTGGGNCGDTAVTEPFVEELPTHNNGGMVIQQPVPRLVPAPTVAPNTRRGLNGLPIEGRTRPHQLLADPRFAPQVFYESRMVAFTTSIHPDLPLQTLWGFDGRFPGPTFVAFYGEPALVRRINRLPADNGGFGNNQVSTHLHNGHTPSESDGFPCDFFSPGQFYDQHYLNAVPGFDDPTRLEPTPEFLSTLWYHDHRVEFTSQNVYKGLAGFYLLFNDFDTGDETTGFHLPTFPDFDIPLLLADRVVDPCTGLIVFDLFNFDGILGDKFLVNGKIQPFFDAEPRRYRFRILNTGPSRFYDLFFTDLDDLAGSIPFWQISNDGNLLPQALKVGDVEIVVAGRMDIVIDLRPFAGRTIYLENRLIQVDGRKPTGDLTPPGEGDLLLQINVGTGQVADQSVDFEQGPVFFYPLPPTEPPRVVRTFEFDRRNGLWAINGQLMDGDCAKPRFTVQRNSAEHWIFVNKSGGWEHPIHEHLEELLILTRNGVPIGPGNVEFARKDVTHLHRNEVVETFLRMRDLRGRYVLHCHNVVHEDHAMMLRFDVEDVGDTNPRP